MPAILAAALSLGTSAERGIAQHRGDIQYVARDQMFSGTVTALAANTLTAVRTGSKDSRTFLITAETRFEGPKPQVSSHVTIRYIATEDGDRAVRIIVRALTK